MANNAQTDTNKNFPYHKVLLTVGLIILAFLIFWAGAVWGHNGRYDNRGFFMMGGDGFGGMMPGRAGHLGVGGLRSVNESRLSGVVTAVNGSSFTLAGGGTTNTVATDSNTKYSGGNKVAVNDSVVVLGTTSNSTFTATRVIINP